MKFPLFELDFKTQTGRESLMSGDFFIKKYADKHECIYEYSILEKIAKTCSTNFLVPKAFKIIVGSNDSFIIMERIKGIPLRKYIINYLLYGKNDVPKMFNNLGKVLRELHYSPLEGLRTCNFPNSCEEIKLEISKLSEKLVTSHILDSELKKAILTSIKGISKMNDEIFTNVNLHGEFYFTHIILSKSKYVFLDFHNACNGPSYFDIAMLSTSLNVSLTLPLLTLRQLTPLIHAFLNGY
ncbi:MAG: hypothetical protein N3D72_02330, partial [Candidatus Methanomethyliaceae archaeon]|nr:hypothetical protein [Candidatus Methanomethyliaceae archaeon]